MPKRTLSSTTSRSDACGSRPDCPSSSISGHTAKFSRLSTSPSPLPSPLLPPSQALMGFPSSSDGTTSSQAGMQTLNLRTASQNSRVVARCSLPPHPPVSFDSVAAFEAHLYSHHTNRCTSCRANFPTSHLLDLHATENHDPLAAARRERGERIYACLVPGCDKLFADRWKRRSHAIDKHAWRKDYDWAIVERGTDGRTSVIKGGAAKKGGSEEQERSKRASLTGVLQGKGVKQISGFPLRNFISQGDRDSCDRKESTSTGSPDIVLCQDNDLPEDADDKAGAGVCAKISPPSLAFSGERLVALTSEVLATEDKDSVGDLVKSMSALKFVPPSVRRNQHLKSKGTSQNVT